MRRRPECTQVRGRKSEVARAPWRARGRRALAHPTPYACPMQRSRDRVATRSTVAASQRRRSPAHRLHPAAGAIISIPQAAYSPSRERHSGDSETRLFCDVPYARQGVGLDSVQRDATRAGNARNAPISSISLGGVRGRWCRQTHTVRSATPDCGRPAARQRSNRRAYRKKRSQMKEGMEMQRTSTKVSRGEDEQRVKDDETHRRGDEQSGNALDSKMSKREEDAP
ncbi:hypothetical protein C8R45DRAFT_1093146 [Mycena sanguinolenta]|nr:hypothetical protein C8R45DRAFT_1093146 [Mycena sanguinolenta]